MKSGWSSFFDRQLLAADFTYRLTTESGVVASGSDRTNQAAIYCTPHQQQKLSLYGGWAGSKWETYTPPEFAIALASLTPGKNYDLFVTAPAALTPSSTNTSTDILTFAAAHGLATGASVRVNESGGGLTAGTDYWFNAASTTTGSLHATVANALAGTSKVDLTASITAKCLAVTCALSAAWTNDSTRADALATQNGVPVKSGAAACRSVGLFRTTGTAATEDSDAKRYLLNRYNRVPRRLFSCPGYTNDNAWSYYSHSSTTFSQVNGGTGAKLEFLSLGDSGAEYEIDFHFMGDGAVGNQTMPGIGLDSTTEALVSAIGDPNGRLNATLPLKAAGLAAGYHYWALLAAVTGGTGKIWSDGARYGASADPYITFGLGRVWA